MTLVNNYPTTSTATTTTSSIVPSTSSPSQSVNPVVTIRTQSVINQQQQNNHRSNNQITIPINYEDNNLINRQQSSQPQESLSPSSPDMHIQTVSTVTRPVPGHRSASYQNAVSVFNGHPFNRGPTSLQPPPHLSHNSQLRMVHPGHRIHRPAPRPPPAHQQPSQLVNNPNNNNNNNYNSYNRAQVPPPVPPFPRMTGPHFGNRLRTRDVPANHPLAIHSHHNLLFQDINNCQYVNIPLPPPPYSTLPSRSTSRRRNEDIVASMSTSAPISSSAADDNSSAAHCLRTSTAASSSSMAGNQSNNHHNQWALSYLPTFLRSLTNSLVNSSGNNGNNGSSSNCANNSRTDCPASNNGSQQCPTASGAVGTSSSSSRNSIETGHSPTRTTSTSTATTGLTANSNITTPTGHRPLPPVLPSYHNLYASSSPSSIRRRRRRMRHSRIHEEDDCGNDPNNYLTENRKQLICISLLVIGSILAFIGLVTVSLFAISFGVTFGLFSFILYRLLPTSKSFSTTNMMTRCSPRRLSPRLAANLGGHPYIIATSGHADHHIFPPPPPSYQEAISGTSSSNSSGLLMLNAANLIHVSGHRHNNQGTNGGVSNPGYDGGQSMASNNVVQAQLVHHHHRQESSISSVGNSSECINDGSINNGSAIHGTGVTVVNVESGVTVNNVCDEMVNEVSSSCPKSVISVVSSFSDHQLHNQEDGDDQLLLDHSIEDSVGHVHHCVQGSLDDVHSRVNGQKKRKEQEFDVQSSDEKSGPTNRSTNLSGTNCGSDDHLTSNGTNNRTTDCVPVQLSGNNGHHHHILDETGSTNRCLNQQPQFITIIEATI